MSREMQRDVDSAKDDLGFTAVVQSRRQKQDMQHHDGLPTLIERGFTRVLSQTRAKALHSRLQEQEKSGTTKAIRANRISMFALRKSSQPGRRRAVLSRPWLACVRVPKMSPIKKMKLACISGKVMLQCC